MTKDELKKDLQKLGIEKDMRLLLHVSLSKIGNVTEGPTAVISALQDLLTENGILVMPAYNCYGEYKPNLSIVNDVFKNIDLKTKEQIIKIIKGELENGKDHEDFRHDVPPLQGDGGEGLQGSPRYFGCSGRPDRQKCYRHR